MNEVKQRLCELNLDSSKEELVINNSESKVNFKN